MESMYEAIVEKDGRIRIQSPVHLKTGTKVFVSFPGDDSDADISGVDLSERVLAADWLNSEEEAAWAHLQLCAMSDYKQVLCRQTGDSAFGK
jgi:hypothetical protein